MIEWLLPARSSLSRRLDASSSLSMPPWTTSGSWLCFSDGASSSFSLRQPPSVPRLSSPGMYGLQMKIHGTARSWTVVAGGSLARNSSTVSVNCHAK